MKLQGQGSTFASLVRFLYPHGTYCHSGLRRTNTYLPMSWSPSDDYFCWLPYRIVDICLQPPPFQLTCICSPYPASGSGSLFVACKHFWAACQRAVACLATVLPEQPHTIPSLFTVAGQQASKPCGQHYPQEVQRKQLAWFVYRVW